MTREVPTSNGLVALVDDADYETVVGRGSWFARLDKNTYYAQRSERGAGQSHTVFMHRLIAGWAGLVDHIDDNGLNNRRANLRMVTHAQNCANRARRSDNTTGFKGVGRTNSRRKPWQGRIWIDGKNVYLGSYLTPEEAARAYDAAALDTWGEYARLNFPKEQAA